MASVTRITPRRGINDEGLGKKHALLRLITQASTEWVWLTDDDVALPPHALDSLHATLDAHPDADLIILPLSMSSGTGSLLERLQQTEYAAIQALTVRTAERGHAVLCSGANLLVRRDLWLECYPDLHPDIPSGDDMFLLEAVKRRGRTVCVALAPVACVTPLRRLPDLLRQRMRWAGKAPRYTDPDILRCGARTLLANLLVALCELLILFFPLLAPWLPLYLLPLLFLPLLVKYLLDLRLIYDARRFDFRVPRPRRHALLLLLLYPPYILLSLFGGLLRSRLHPRRW